MRVFMLLVLRIVSRRVLWTQDARPVCRTREQRDCVPWESVAGTPFHFSGRSQCVDPAARGFGENISGAPRAFRASTASEEHVPASWWLGHEKRFDGVSTFLDAFMGPRRTTADFEELRELGLRRVYVGLESGDDDLLKWLCKPATSEGIAQCVTSLKTGRADRGGDRAVGRWRSRVCRSPRAGDGAPDQQPAAGPRRFHLFLAPGDVPEQPVYGADPVRCRSSRCPPRRCARRNRPSARLFDSTNDAVDRTSAVTNWKPLLTDDHAVSRENSCHYSRPHGRHGRVGLSRPIQISNTAHSRARRCDRGESTNGPRANLFACPGRNAWRVDPVDEVGA